MTFSATYDLKAATTLIYIYCIHRLAYLGAVGNGGDISTGGEICIPTRNSLVDSPVVEL